MPGRASIVQTTAVLASPGSLAAIKEAGLRFASDLRPGIRRVLEKDTFAYLDAEGNAVVDEVTLERIRSLAIPPAWREVWICHHTHGHIQATGRDARGRKQYRYHPRWRETRNATKFHRMAAFAAVLPGLRRRVARDLEQPGMPRTKVLATIVRLLETTFIRVGNDEYARENRSFGLTTLRNRHVTVGGSKPVFTFRGKSGRRHRISLEDRQLARVVKRCQEMPGQELFVYEDEDGGVHHIGSHDVNDYLREVTGGEFTAKDFRTWAGTVLAAIALRELGPAQSQAQARRNITMAVEATALKLGNTPAVCRKCYVHPQVLQAYAEGLTIAGTHAAAPRALKPEERAVLALLNRRAGRQAA